MAKTTTASLLAVLLAVVACSTVAPRGAASSVRGSAGKTPGPTIPASSGQIAGHLGFPAGILPAETIYAIATDGSRFFTVESVFGQASYTMVGVAPGDYYVLGFAPMDLSRQVSSTPGTNAVYRFETAYTKFVTCGSKVGCNDHSMLSVHVSAGTTISGVDPGDWYVEHGTYQAIPPSGAMPSRAGVPEFPPGGAILQTFQDPTQAAIYVATASMSGRYVAAESDCPANVACVWLIGRKDGVASGYFTIGAGSNRSIQTCAIYLIDTSAGWQLLGENIYGKVCSASGQPFPTVGQSGQIQLALGETGCVNVHAEPSLTAKVVACLPEGSAVTIDDGPVYAVARPPIPPSDLPYALDYWWHLAGRGWVVHAYVFTRHYG